MISRTEKLLLKLFDHFDIVKTVGGEVLLYLRRFYLARSRYGSVFLHKIARSDDDPDPHCHPFPFISLILKSGYIDESYEFFNTESPGKDPAAPFVRDTAKGLKSGVQHFSPDFKECIGVRTKNNSVTVKPGQLIYRPARHIHRVVLHRGTAWTLVITGPESRPWGFSKANRWVFWREYLGLYGNNKDHA